MLTQNSDFARLEAVVGSVSRETFERLKAFEKEFVRWAERINLVAPSTLENIWERHILDSAQLLTHSPLRSRWVDLGSGGGFPGAVLAILLTDTATVDMIESNRKKASFLQTVLASIGSAGRVHASRIEDVLLEADIVTARALAPLPLLLDMSSRWLTHGAKGLFHKGRGYRAEVEECRDVWDFDLIEHPSSVAPGGVILEISQLRRL